MRTLILSCNTGEGHNSCAKAIKEVFDAHGVTCDIIDTFAFISHKASRFLSKGHVFMYRHSPAVFNIGYSYAEKHDRLFNGRTPVNKFFASASKRLHDYIIGKDYDTIICTHSLTALMLAQTLKKNPISVKTAFVATDYTCSPGVKNSNLDIYFIPDESLTEEFEIHQVPRDKIVFSGIPIRQMFYTHTDKTVAKTRLGLSPNKKHILIASGSMGCGPIEELTDRLTAKSQEQYEVSVICGSNENLKKKLEQLYGNRSCLHICGYVHDMSQMLDSADLYLTKAGGISTAEAAEKNLPMLFINAVTGCESYNNRFYLNLGGAESAVSIDDIYKKTMTIIQSNARCHAMSHALALRKKPNAAECIYQTLIE